ncbi:class I SAM-dependent methyltransferase [Photobacterium sp.]|uniref:class I SAM-dependent methyltransferase n=1 Tax=Photobacterium sp. TaxID=660 RepID=UPI00299ECEA7|nr:methyltransferase domain-containing protein [Photobacterium sp.]MDX1301529.1 methyltransferase domain-containing protein [Photobacterium sp.]
MLSRQDVQRLYQAGAKNYDFTTLLFRLIGLRMNTYRSIAIERLSLKRGDVVVELGCGTGLNFPLLLEKIGEKGRLIGVDLTPGMLDIARKRVEQNSWQNVELIQSDIAAYEFPQPLNAVLVTGVLGYIPEYDQVIKAVADALKPDGHLSILDGKQPENLPLWLIKIVLKLGGQFGYTPEYFSVRPWVSVEHYFKEMSFETHYGGMIYIASGTTGQ